MVADLSLKPEDLGAAFPLNQVFRSRSRTVTEGEFALLQSLTWQTAAIHTDGPLMADSQFGERIASGSHLLSLSMGLSGTSGMQSALQAAGYRGVAQLAIERVAFTAPLRPNDTIRVETEIVDVRPTSKPERFIATYSLTTYNQRGERLMQGSRLSLIERVRQQE